MTWVSNSGTSGSIGSPTNLTIIGNDIYVASMTQHVIQRISNSGSYSMTTVIGTAGTSGYKDDIGANALINDPRGLTTDGIDLYISDTGNNRIRRYELRTGKVTTIAGDGTFAYQNGTGVAAKMGNNAIVSDGKNLFFTERIVGQSNRFRKITNNGLVAYYPLNGNAKDYAGTNNLTIVGSPTTTTGKFNEVNGAYSNVAGAGFKVGTPVMSASNTLTISGWYKWNGTGSGNQILFFNGQTSSPGYEMYMQSTGLIYALHYGGSTLETSTGYKMTANVWTHLLLTCDSSNNWTFYINGKPYFKYTHASSTPTGNTSIGVSQVNAESFIGSISDVRIYNNALSDTAIRQLANQIPNGLLARFDFTGDYADVSGWGRTVTPAGATGTNNTPILTTDRFGNANAAYNFDGTDDRFLFSDAGFPTGTANRTICIWYRIKSLPLASEWRLFFGYGNGTSGQTSLLGFYNAAGVMKTEMHYFGAAGGSSPYLTYTSATNNWNHICALNGAHPMQVTNSSTTMKMHYQADSLSNLADNASVTGWTDNSNSGNDVTQGTPANQPVYKATTFANKPGIEFVAGKSLTATSGLAPANTSTTFIAHKTLNPIDSANGNQILNYGDMQVWLTGSANSYRLRLGRSGGAVLVDSTVNFSTIYNVPVISAYTYDYNVAASYHHNGTVNTFGTPATNQTFTGNNLTISGMSHIGDIIYYNAVLSATDRELVECYLSSKYGIPLGHSCP